MNRFLILILFAMQAVGGCADVPRGEICFGGRQIVMERIGVQSSYFWLATVKDRDGKPIPCAEAK